MAVFAYRAVDARSAAVAGTIVADSPRQVRDQLRAQGLSVHEVTLRGSTANAAGGGAAAGIARGTRHGPKVTGFVRELSTLLGVGIPLLDAVQTLGRSERGRFRGVLLQLEDRVAAGGSLAAAMRDQPQVFDELAISMAEVGESAGNLDAVLDRLAEFRERSDALRGKIATALLYPAIVLVVAVAVSLLLMTFVVPKLLAAMVESGQPIPTVTRVVKFVSDALVRWWWLLLGGTVATAVAAGVALRGERGRRAWDRAQLRVPILGDAVRKQAIVRIALVMSTLMKSGVVFVRALEIARRATTNTEIRDALARCESAVTGGTDISAALRDTGAFPPMVVQIFAVGQQSGRLEEMLDRLAVDYDRQVTTLTTRLTALLEPLLILVMVAVVGVIALATILPMLQAADAM